MTEEPLIQGRGYKLIATEKNIVWPGRLIVYVRKENLPDILPALKG